ncbi:MAG: hypothetical protein ACTSRP_12405 [Candidatus Helarchaeota archaeon]
MMYNILTLIILILCLWAYNIYDKYKKYIKREKELQTKLQLMTMSMEVFEPTFELINELDKLKKTLNKKGDKKRK